MVFGEAEFLSQGGIVGCVQVRRQFESAEDARVHFRTADSCGEIQPCHSLGGADEVRGGGGGIFFGGGEDKVCQRSLKIAERGSVNVVNDDGHASAPRGEPAENSRLAAVGVDDVRFGLAKN